MALSQIEKPLSRDDGLLRLPDQSLSFGQPFGYPGAAFLDKSLDLLLHSPVRNINNDLPVVFDPKRYCLPSLLTPYHLIAQRPIHLMTLYYSCPPSVVHPWPANGA